MNHFETQGPVPTLPMNHSETSGLSYGPQSYNETCGMKDAGGIKQLFIPLRPVKVDFVLDQYLPEIQRLALI